MHALALLVLSWHMKSEQQPSELEPVQPNLLSFTHCALRKRRCTRSSCNIAAVAKRTHAFTAATGCLAQVSRLFACAAHATRAACSAHRQARPKLVGGSLLLASGAPTAVGRVLAAKRVLGDALQAMGPVGDRADGSRSRAATNKKAMPCRWWQMAFRVNHFDYRVNCLTTEAEWRTERQVPVASVAFRF